MQRLETASARTLVTALAVVIIVGGFALTLLSNITFSSAGTTGGPGGLGPTSAVSSTGSSNNFLSYLIRGNPSGSNGATQVISVTTEMSTTTASLPVGGLVAPAGADGSSTSPTKSVAGGSSIEFSSDLSITARTPSETSSGVVALAYSVGGYVAYQSTFKASAYVVIRVPASNYQTVLSKVEALGNVTSLVSNSNDVTVEYTDLNATLASLRTEQGALLRLLNQSTTVNSTLAIEAQLQQINQQIDYTQSQILQTKRLIDYSTINVTISKSTQSTPLSLTLTATPMAGKAPLSVTFNAITKGGLQPYFVNYNFDDGSSEQGQILIHTFYSSGDYNVTATVTDQNGTVAVRHSLIHVVSAPNHYGATDFPATVANLFVNVVEGIVEVAAIVLPLAAVGAVVLIPLRRRSRLQKLKQSQ